jgi:hypothetical protein
MAWSNNTLLFVLGILLKYQVNVRACNHKKSFLRHTQTERERERERERDVKEKPSQQMMNIKVSVQ